MLRAATLLIILAVLAGCTGEDDSRHHGNSGGNGASGGSGGSGATGGEGGWQLPIGIPMPSFGITEEAPPAPSPWDAPVPGYYYVDMSSPAATDEGNDYGTPALPRRTIPETLGPGSVVELHGAYDQGHTSPHTFQLDGTAAAPVFIRGASAEARPLVRNAWETKGSYYILENLEMGPLDELTTGDLSILAPTDHGVLRKSDIHGNLSGGGVGVASWTGEYVNDVVIAFCSIHDNGDMNADYDQDVHGIGVGAQVSNLWVLDNELARNSGDGIQINGGQEGQASLHHVYVGHNLAHENKQTGFWTKQAVDVIFSQNASWAHRPGNSSLGGCAGYQYAPDYVWFIDNVFTDCHYGIQVSSDSDLGFGQNAFFVGNVIFDIHDLTGGFEPGSAWASAGIMLAGGVVRYAVGNTIDDADGGIHVAGGGEVHISDNILGNVTQPEGAHVFIEQPYVAAASTMDRDLLAGTVRLKWGDYQPNGSLAALCTGCVAADPGFVDVAMRDYHLTEQSPAVDAGSESPVYQIFRDRYGLDIDIDIEGHPRPAGAGWDVGAFESW